MKSECKIKLFFNRYNDTFKEILIITYHMKMYTLLFYFQCGKINAVWINLHETLFLYLIICDLSYVGEVLREIYFSKLVILNTVTLKLNDKPYMYTFVLWPVCPSIAHCLEMHCNDTAASTICANCEGEVTDAPYHRAYVKSGDKKQCLSKYM